ncbi:MAG: DUF1223 domain-containing protein [Alphaproteobacteria bacterium]|nr:DUF1223 domain-containing protein [Alphaproteobacteria bacterium]
MAGAWIATAAIPASSGPVVVELYTSQGCSTCPPADELLGELKQRDDVLPLSIHVNYWDYIGWPDPFATQAGTDRQRAYARPLHQRFIYTPQMVFQGQAHEAGHRRLAVINAIEAAKSSSDLNLDLTFAKNADGLMTVSVPASAFSGDAEVTMVLFDDAHTTDIKRGENADRSLTYHNVVRSLEPIGRYEGAAVTFTLPMDSGGDGCVIIVQQADLGPVIGAGQVRLTN